MENIELRLDVEGMTCINCKKILTKGINNLDGISNVSINLNTKEITLVFNPSKITQNKIEEQITKQGFVVLQYDLSI